MQDDRLLNKASASEGFELLHLDLTPLWQLPIQIQIHITSIIVMHIVLDCTVQPLLTISAILALSYIW